MKSATKTLWLGVTAFFLFSIPYFSSLTNSWNRLEITWTRSDPFAVAFLLLLGGGALSLAVVFVRRLVPPESLRDKLLLFFLFVVIWPGVNAVSVVKNILAVFPGAAALQSRAALFFRSEEILKILLIGFYGYMALRLSNQAKKLAVIVLKIFSPAVLIFLVQLFWYPVIPTGAGEIPSAPILAPGKTPVFFYLFDECSYGHAMVSGNPAPGLLALSEISRQSFVFHRAFSPGNVTNESVPRILGEFHFDPASKEYNVNNSVFQDAYAAGWKNYLVGCYLPYALWFKGVSEFSRQVPAYKAPEGGFFNDLLSHAVLDANFSLIHWNAKLAEFVYEPYAVMVQKKRVDYCVALAKDVEEISGAGTFAYFHFSLPHDPFINVKADSSPSAGYFSNIVISDRILGDLMQILKKRGIWDRSLVIVTSDHGWKKDPQVAALSSPDDREALLRHVPLFVKLPGQGARRDVATIFPTENLKKLLETFFRGDRRGGILSLGQ